MKRAIASVIITVVYGAICAFAGYGYSTATFDPVQITYDPKTIVYECTCDHTVPEADPEPVIEEPIEEIVEPEPEPEQEPPAEPEEPEYPLTQYEIELIALVTMAEAEGESEIGQRLVIDTILNRVDSPRFPNTVHEVIYQPHQFSTVWSDRITKCKVTEEIVELVKEESLLRINRDVLFFRSGHYHKYGTPLMQVGRHYFSIYE